jgi:uncharacterized membrane protein
MNKKIALAWGLVFLAVVGYLFFIVSDLPNRLAVHFDINGNPNGFQSKYVFITTFFCFAFFINGLFLAMSWGISRLPTAIINIAWKQYWFATEDRKRVAFEKLREVMGLTGIFVCTTFLFTEQVIYQANAQNPFLEFSINAGVMVIGVLAVFFIVLVFMITKPPTENG